MGHDTDTLTNLALASGGLDRRADDRARPNLIPDLRADPRTRVLELRGDQAPTTTGVDGLELVLRSAEPADEHGLTLFLGRDESGVAYLAVAGPATDAGDASRAASSIASGTATDPRPDEPDGVAWRTLRQSGADLTDRHASIFATALALTNWHQAHQFCPRCGAPTAPAVGGWLRRCERDGSEHYPRTDVAIIVSVLDDQDRILLARGVGWGPGRYSVLAGFLEPGESLDAAVRREVAEEVGVDLSDVTYLGDQPWPFPSSIMVGFTARAVGATVLTLQDAEIAEARWFTREEYRDLVRSGHVGASTRLSIARRLIERWLGEPLDQLS